MTRLALITLAAVLAVAVAQAGAQQQNKNQTQGNQEQPGPFNFPGPKTMQERLMLSGDQEAALVRIYNDYKKKDQKLQQAQQQAAANKNKDNTSPATANMPDAATLKGNMIMEIRMILATDDQKKKFQEMCDDMGKKKKKNT